MPARRPLRRPQQFRPPPQPLRRPQPPQRPRLGPSLPPSWPGRLGTSALQGCGLLGTSHLLDALARVVPGHAASRLALELEPAIGLAVFAAIFVAVLVAIVEEILFRGLAFEGLRRRLGLGAAILGSALLFGLAHLDLHQGVAATLLGVQLGALRAFLGLPLAIFAHALNNAAAVLAGAGGLETSTASLAFAALLSVAALHALIRRARAARRALQPAPGTDEPSGGNAGMGMGMGTTATGHDTGRRRAGIAVARRPPNTLNTMNALNAPDAPDAVNDGDRDERGNERGGGGSEHPAGRRR